MAKGWIKLHRQLLDNPIWCQKPFSEGQAWVDLLLLADSTDSGKYKRGSVYRGKEWLSKRWGWSRGRVTRFLNKLEDFGMVTQKRSHGGAQNGTVTTIVKYGDFQNKRSQYDTQYDTQNGTPIRRKEEVRSSVAINSTEQKEEKPKAYIDDEGYIIADDPMDAYKLWLEEQKKNDTAN